MKAASAEQSTPTSADKGEASKRTAKAQTRRMIAHAFDKLAQLVVQHRVADARRSVSTEHTPPPWVFNLFVPDLPAVSAETQQWRKDHRPMHVFVFHGAEGERKLLEHWQLTYSSKTATIPPNISVVYAKFVMLFRSVFLYLKILPAYKAFMSELNALAPSRISFEILPAAPHPFWHSKPDRVDFGRIDTAFGNMELQLWYRKDVDFALSERPQVIPAESIIPDYAPSLSSKIPIRPPTSKPMSIQATVQDVSARDRGVGRQRSSTGTATLMRPKPSVEARSQPSLDHTRLSFSPPVVGAHSVYPVTRDRQQSEPPFPHFGVSSPRGIMMGASPRASAGAFSTSTSPRMSVGSATSAGAGAIGGGGGFSQSPLFKTDTEVEEILSRVSGGLVNSEADRILTAVSPPSFSMYEKALHESPDAEIDGPVFAIEGSFADDEESAVSAFVRHCQSKPPLVMVEQEQQVVAGANSPYAAFCSMDRSERRKIRW